VVPPRRLGPQNGLVQERQFAGEKTSGKFLFVSRSMIASLARRVMRKPSCGRETEGDAFCWAGSVRHGEHEPDLAVAERGTGCHDVI
jgi:hypothetical protein